MKIQINSNDSSVILSIDGNITADNFIELKNILHTIDPYKDLYFNCENLNSIDASGLTLLCSLFMNIISYDSELYVYKLTDQPKQLFDYLNISPMFTETLDSLTLIPLPVT